MIVERDSVTKSFSNAAETYDLWAKPQKEIARRLVELLPVEQDYNNILDLGCGTGNVVEQLLTRYSSANILGIDIAPGMVDHCTERWSNSIGIKFSKYDISSFKPELNHDLIISSCVLQWIDDFYGVLKNLSFSLEDGDNLAIAVPIKGSFFELQESYKSLSGYNMPGLKYKAKEHYTDIAMKCGLDIRVCEVETVYGSFNGMDVLKYFKKIGATFQHNRDYSPLGLKDIHRLIEYYENTYGLHNGLLPVTHQVLYLTAYVCRR